MSLISYKEAQKKIHHHINPLTDTETVTLTSSLRRIIAKSYNAERNIPNFDNAALDGVAIPYADYVPNVPMPLSPITIHCGMNPENFIFTPAHAVHITTGAPIPNYCDTVVAKEHININDNHVSFTREVTQKSNVRKAGEDHKKANVLISKAKQLSNADIAVLASAGYSHIEVFKKLKISIISNGDELLHIGQAYQNHKVYDANTPLLHTLISDFNCQVQSTYRLNDDLNMIQTSIEQAIAQSDMLIITAGASQGESDYIKKIIAKLGTLVFSGVSIKPGRPIGLAIVEGKPVFSLPGNTVAVYVCFLMFVRQAIQQFYGIRNTQQDYMYLPIMHTIENTQNRLERTEFWRGYMCQKTHQTCVAKYENDGSGLIRSIRDTQGLIEIPPHTHIVKQNQNVKFYPYPLLMQL